MKFENVFRKQMVHEWAEAYMDYNGLKRLLREISSQKKIKNMGSRSGELTSQSRNCDNTKDIENQVEDVEKSQEHRPRQFLKSISRMKREEMSETEVTFFRKLDEELDKVNFFYKEKVEAAIKEASLLDKQVETWVALQREREVSSLNGSGSRGQDSCVEVSTVPLRSSSNRPSSSGRENMDLLEVDTNDKHEQNESDCRPEIDQVHTATATCELIEETISNDNQHYHQEIKHVKAHNVVNSLMSTVKRTLKKHQKDDFVFEEDDQRKIEKQLRKAFAEFFRWLHSLKQYSFMNLSAFSRIMKKSEKILSKTASRSYMETVDNSYLGSSDEVADLMKVVEITFIKNFSNSNYAEAKKYLRPKMRKEKHSVTFVSGFLSGCMLALLLATILRIESEKLMYKEDGTHYMESIFPLYSLFGYIVLHMLVFAADIFFWRQYRVNYQFIFGSKRGTKIGYREVFLLGTGLAVLGLAGLLANLYLDMDPRVQKYRRHAEKVPLGTAAFILLITVCPFNILYRSSRFFLLRCVLHCICAPFWKVTFPDYFLADQLTSQVQALRCIVLYICYYALGEYSRQQNKCHRRGDYNTLYFVIAVIPFWLRFLQCIRRLFEEKHTIHGYNALKYFSTIVAVLIRTACELRKGATWMVLALASSAVALVINTFWDIFVDWGLLRKHSKNKYLRDRLLVSNKSAYFAAMILNILLRIAWMQLVLAFNMPSFQKVAVTASISCLEIIRRGLWNFFSLENEHLNNVGKYRAFKSVPLPFSDSDDENCKDD